MAASILWAPGKFAFFLQENPHAHKITRLGGGVFWVGGGRGGSADFILMGAGTFLNYRSRERKDHPEVFQTEVLSCTSAWDALATMLVFQDLEGLEESLG